MKRKTVLISAFACSPHWGSEVGMGWNWVINLAKHADLIVITESSWESKINAYFEENDKIKSLKFIYVSAGDTAMRLFWKQGSPTFYWYYNKWQKKTYSVATKVCKEINIDIVHQLNMLGYREPGYLYKIKHIPFVYGPIGGYAQFPIKFLRYLGIREMLFYLTRNTINTIQSRILPRPKKAYRFSKFSFVATPISVARVGKYSSVLPLIIPETGTDEKFIDCDRKIPDEYLDVIWVGKVKGSKALRLALDAVNLCDYKSKIRLHVVGDGPLLEREKHYAMKLGLNNVLFYGKVENTRTKTLICASDVMLITSLLEATTTVVFEAFERGVPVVCHDAFGLSEVVDKYSGVKIPLRNPSDSIVGFSQTLDKLIEEPSMLNELKTGTKAAVKRHTWAKKAELVNLKYDEVLNQANS